MCPMNGINYSKAREILLLPEKPLFLFNTNSTHSPASLPQIRLQLQTKPKIQHPGKGQLPQQTKPWGRLSYQGKKSGKMLSASSFRARPGLPKSKPHSSTGPAWSSWEQGSGSPRKLGSAQSTGLLLARAGPPLPSTDPGRKGSISKAGMYPRHWQKTGQSMVGFPVLPPLCPL